VTSSWSGAVAGLPAEAADPPQELVPSRRSIWLGAARSGSARLLVLPVSALLGIVVTRLIVENYGTAAFAQYGLLVAIGALLPFADLGMGAAVINTVAASDAPATDERLRRVLITAIRVLLCSAAVLGAVAVAVTLLGLWPELLGPGLLSGSGSLVAMTCLLCIAATMPLGIGQRIMTGLRMNHLTIVVGGLQTPLVLAILLVALWLGAAAGPVVAVFAYASTFLLTLVIAVIAARRVRPLLRRALADVPRVRSVRGGRVMDVAWPMLVQMIALPIAMQTDRIVLSHRGGVDVLAEYNLAAQMFTPIWGVVSAAGVTLWPVFAKARARGVSDSPVPMSWVFGGVAAVMALAVAAASPFLADLASGGRIGLGGLLVASFTVFMVLQGLKYPLGMFMTDAAGLRFQALMIVLMLPVNVGLSWYLAGELGAAGPVIGSIVGVGLFQVLANHLYVRRRLHAAAAAAEGTVR
jgi:O-antigen/teichoic acid export membrane protein